MLRIPALLLLPLVACAAPESYDGEELPELHGAEVQSAEPAPAEPQTNGRFQLDPDFDIFEDDAETGPTGVPFTQEVLEQRVAEIAPRVSQMRNMPWLGPVPAGLQSADDFIEFAIADFEQEYGMENFRAMAEAYRLLGLIDPEIDLFDTTMELLRGQVGGYYDPRTKKFYMIDSYTQGALADIILAHELTHALDDQHFDLQALMSDATTADEEFAVRAVVEGSGTSLMNLYAVQGALAGWLELDPAAMTAEMAGQAESMEGAPPYLIMTLALPYLEGNKLLTRQDNLLAASMAQPTDADLRALFANPPRSSEQVLHIEKYWDPEQADEPVPVELDALIDRFGDDWELQHTDVLGELACFVATAESLPDLTTATGQLAGKWTNAAATGWGGDRYISMAGPDGARVLVWHTLWDSPEDAVEFEAALRSKAAATNSFFHSMSRNGISVRVIYANPAGRTTAAQL